MNTRPDPSKLFVVAGPQLKTFHLGFYPKNRTRPIALCRALIWNLHKNMYIKNSGTINCTRCQKKLKSIKAAIKKLGLEWVCYGHYLPMEERTFTAQVNAKITINPR